MDMQLLATWLSPYLDICIISQADLHHHACPLGIEDPNNQTAGVIEPRERNPHVYFGND